MRKAFDTIDHPALVRALRSRGLPEAYVSLLALLYANQMASVNGSKKNPNPTRGKQGDIPSAILLNCVLDVAFDEWRRSLDREGLYIAQGVPRLTSIRYADDIILYAKSLEELVSMTERLMNEFQRIGLTLNAKKTKNLRSNPGDDDCTLNFVEIGSEFVKILNDTDSHRYLGRLLCTSASDRIKIEIRNRQRAAWASFHKHKSVLLDHHVSLQLRLKYFDACVGPTILFGMVVFPMTRCQIGDMDRLQLQMLRRIDGWRRIDGEEWKERMKRMNLQLSRGLDLHYCQPWSISFARNQWRYVDHIIDGNLLMWSRVMCKYNFNPIYDLASLVLPRRSVGHPQLRWDDHIHNFCWKIWPQYRGCHWFNILSQHRLLHLEDEYVAHTAGM